MSRHDGLIETAKVSPGATMLGAWMAGVSINEWAAVAGLLLTLMAIGEKLYRWRQAWKARRAAAAAE